MLKIGVLGVGHLGKIHLNCLGMLENVYEITGFFDPDDDQAAQAEEKYGIPRFSNLDELMAAVDVVDIVTPTPTHFDLAKKAVEAGCHLFIEKPVTQTIEQADQLLKLSREKGVKVQVGHVERFNPALLSLAGMKLKPMFVEAHRLSMFNPRGTDVSVVLDLMIHDVDILLTLVGSEVTSISASGVNVLSETPDICNAHLEFANGCIANLTASRISLKQMRKMRFFQKDAYISLDFLEKQAQVVRMFEEDDPNSPPKEQMMSLPTAKGERWIHVEMPGIEPVNAIKMELETFAQCIRTDTNPKVSLEDGYEALKVAYRIMDSLQERSEKYKL
jgi:predicted dehydrogenase